MADQQYHPLITKDDLAILKEARSGAGNTVCELLRDKQPLLAYPTNQELLACCLGWPERCGYINGQIKI